MDAQLISVSLWIFTGFAGLVAGLLGLAVTRRRLADADDRRVGQPAADAVRHHELGPAGLAARP